LRLESPGGGGAGGYYRGLAKEGLLVDFASSVANVEASCNQKKWGK